MQRPIPLLPWEMIVCRLLALCELPGIVPDRHRRRQFDCIDGAINGRSHTAWTVPSGRGTRPHGALDRARGRQLGIGGLVVGRGRGSMTTHDPRALRDAFGSFLTGVTVVTTFDGDGSPIGFTANSFTSVSLDPPLLLVCLAKTSRNYNAVTTAPGFAINILSETQKEVSNTFARPVADRFATVDWRRGPWGSPIFSDVAAWFDCALHEVIDAGDHVVLIGRVEAFGDSAANGLGYARGAYFTPPRLDRRFPQQRKARPCWVPSSSSQAPCCCWVPTAGHSQSPNVPLRTPATLKACRNSCSAQRVW